MNHTRQEKESLHIIQAAQEELGVQGFVSWDVMSEQQQARLELLAARLQKVQALGGAFSDIRLAPELEAAMAGALVEAKERSAALVH